jgi:hypothetical protein
MEEKVILDRYNSEDPTGVGNVMHVFRIFKNTRLWLI